MVMIAISSIGLLVGGVGVHEHHARLGHGEDPRDRVRKALGPPQNRDILWQFLTEAMTLTAPEASSAS